MNQATAKPATSNQLKLYNPKTRQVEPVALGPDGRNIRSRLSLWDLGQALEDSEIALPATDGPSVGIYICGITPYDTTHLGHAFTYAVGDHLIRLLELLGYPVRYVQNVTDIDDDILRKAGEVGEDWQTLGNRWTRHFIQDMQQLNMRPPDYFPRATAYIEAMQQTIAKLLERDVAYTSAGSVYYDATTCDHFGNVSGLEPDALLPTANEHGNVPDDPHKRDPLDFPLWQAQKPGEPAWESPWGPGRPGWHIECSSMATTLLGDTVDFHGGGSDLAFPHHECEIAQAEAATGVRPFVRYWFHAAMVQYEGEKMSKSLGNLVMARDLLREITPDALRLYLASQHYRKPWSFDQDELRHSAEQAATWSKAATIAAAAGGTGDALEFSDADVAGVLDAYLDDLNTPRAVAALDVLANKLLSDALAGNEVTQAQRTFVRLASVLGLRLTSTMPASRTIAGWNKHLQEFEPAAAD